MTRVDFYVLDSPDTAARLELVCKLIDKATARGQRVFVHSDDAPLLKALDDSLWHFRPDRFIAHRLVIDDADVMEGEDETPAADLETVTLSCSAPRRTDAILINLSSAVPVFFSRFERTLEIVNQQESDRADARERYRFYKDRGYPLQHHHL